MFSIKFYIVIIILISLLVVLYLFYKKINKVKNIVKKQTNIKEIKHKNDLKSLREKLAKSKDPNTKNEIINKINLIINNFKK